MGTEKDPLFSLAQLKKRIERAKETSDFPVPSPLPPSSSLGKIFNVGVELIAGVLAGVAGGLGVDWLFKSSPWGLILFFILGAFAGFLNVYRTLIKRKD